MESSVLFVLNLANLFPKSKRLNFHPYKKMKIHLPAFHSLASTVHTSQRVDQRPSTPRTSAQPARPNTPSREPEEAGRQLGSRVSSPSRAKPEPHGPRQHRPSAQISLAPGGMLVSSTGGRGRLLAFLAVSSALFSLASASESDHKVRASATAASLFLSLSLSLSLCFTWAGSPHAPPDLDLLFCWISSCCGGSPLVFFLVRGAA
jgi:hypothetical protein